MVPKAVVKLPQNEHFLNGELIFSSIPKLDDHK